MVIPYLIIHIRMSVCVCVCIYIYNIYIHTYIIYLFIFCFVVLWGIKSSVWHMLSNHSTPELHP
jgi:hypothetical protein